MSGVRCTTSWPRAPSAPTWPPRAWCRRKPELSLGASTAYLAGMISRYARPEAAAIWSPQTRFKIMFEIEAHAADAMAEIGTIPKLAAEAIWERGRDAVWDVDRIDEIEREVKHDVIAFLTHVT